MHPTGLPAWAHDVRQATRDAHRLLDHHPILAALTSSGLSPVQYGRALAALHGAYAGLDGLLQSFSPLPSRLPLLTRDLQVLGLTACPLTAPVPVAEHLAHRLGMLYVVEGSNLGGMVIGRWLHSRLPASLPRSFFSGEDAAPRWAAFWAFAARLSDVDTQALCDGALNAFGFFRAHLDTCPHPPAV